MSPIASVESLIRSSLAIPRNSVSCVTLFGCHCGLSPRETCPVHLALLGWVVLLVQYNNKENRLKEALSVLMLCMPVLIFTSGSSALFLGAHVVVYRSDCCYLSCSIHFSDFMSIFCPAFSYDMKMAANGH